MDFSFFPDACLDALMDNLRMLPFLFASFLILEALEHHSSRRLPGILQHRRLGPIAGGLLGCIPQCGFAALASGLYCGGAVTIGTLIAIYLSTSDEAILILMAHPEKAGIVGMLLLVKLAIAIPAGFLVDFLWNLRPHKEKHAEDLCEHCGCHNHHGILRPALNHTWKLFLFLFLFALALNLIMETYGTQALSDMLLGGSILQPFLTALVGLIPNCAASILITQLFLDGAISFGAAVAGLCTGAGAGLIILFRTGKNVRETASIAGILYVISVFAGILLQLL